MGAKMIGGKIIFKKPKAFIRKHIAATVKRMLGVVGLEWHRNTIPGHFDESASAKYGYRKRTVKHRQEKMRKYGHQRPLVFHGPLSAMVMRLARINPTGKGVRVTMKGPRYLHQRRKDQRQPDKAAELTKTTNRELVAISSSLKKHIKAELRKTAAIETTKI